MCHFFLSCSSYFLSTFACEGFKEVPFPPAATERLRLWLWEQLRLTPHTPDRLPGDADRSTQRNVQVRALGSLLCALGDPDWRVFGSIFAKGVPVGVGKRLPRTPAVYERKRRWSLPERATVGSETSESLDDGEGGWCQNYTSATAHAALVEATLRQQATDGDVFAFSE